MDVSERTALYVSKWSRIQAGSNFLLPRGLDDKIENNRISVIPARIMQYMTFYFRLCAVMNTRGHVTHLQLSRCHCQPSGCSQS